MCLQRGPGLCAAHRAGLHSVGVVPHHPSCTSLPLWSLLLVQLLGQASPRAGRKGDTALSSQMPPTTTSSKPSTPSWTREGVVGMEGRTAPLSHSPRFDSLYEHDPPIRNQGLISQLTASSSIISIQTN